MCVGRRNYRYYYGFILLIALVTLLMNVQVIYLLTVLDKKGELVIFIFNVGLAMYFFAAFAFVAVLTGFHSYLIFTNKTTS